MNANIKIFEVRDRATCIPVMATRLDSNFNTRESKLIHRAGYGIVNGDEYTILTKLNNAKSTYNPYDWDDRTLFNAHKYIHDNWNEIESGDIIDVQFILKETDHIVETDIAVEAMIEDGHISRSALSGVKFDDCLADAERLIGKGFFPALDDFEAEPKVDDVMFKVLMEYDLMMAGEVEEIHKNSIPGIRKKVFAFFEKWLPYVANEQEKKMYQDLLG